MEQLNQSQKERMRKVIRLLKQCAMVIDEVDNEFYIQGSFPESPMGHASEGLELTAYYIDCWVKEGIEL